MRLFLPLALALGLFGSLMLFFPHDALSTVYAQSADTAPITPRIQNMTELWEWGGRISVMKAVGDTLYVNMGRDFVLFDITDPAAPQELGHMDLDALILDIEIVEPYALLAGGSDGLFIVDVSDRRNPALVAERHDPYRVNSIAVDGQYAYVAFEEGGDTVGGVQILDIAQPEAPVVVNERISGLAFEPNDLQIANGHLFVAGRVFQTVAETYYTQKAFQAFRLTDPVDPIPLPAYYAEKIYNMAIGFNAILIKNDDAYLTQRDGITKFAIHDPAQLITSTQLSLEGISTRSPQLVDDRLYVVRPPDLVTGASDNSGLYILDASLPSSIRIEKYLAQPATVITVQDKYAYVSSADDGLHVLNVSTPLTPTEVDKLKMPALFFADLAMQQQILYATGGILGTPLLSTIDLQDPMQPTLTTIITGPERISFYPFTDNERLIVAALTPGADGYDQSYIFDISEPKMPRPLAKHAAMPFSAASYANHLFYTETSNRTPPSAQIRSFDLSDPSHPIQKDVIPVVYNSTASLHSFSVDGEYLYYIGDTEPNAEPRQWTPHLYIYALSTSQAIGTLELPQRIGEVYHHANTLYAVAYWQIGSCRHTIYIVDTTDPRAPYLRQSFCWHRQIEELLFDGHLLYIADRDTTYTRNSETGLSVLDFTIPHAPRLAGYAYEPSAVAQIAAQDDTIYFSGYRLAAYRYTPPQATTHLDQAADTLDAAFDHVTYHFAADTFPTTATTTVTVTHTTRFVDPLRAFRAPQLGVGNAFALTATAADSGAALQPNQPFSITITYMDEALQLVDETTLALYRWAGDEWVKEESSQVNPETNTVTIAPGTTGIWMLSGMSPGQQYLPLIAN